MFDLADCIPDPRILHDKLLADDMRWTAFVPVQWYFGPVPHFADVAATDVDDRGPDSLAWSRGRIGPILRTLSRARDRRRCVQTQLAHGGQCPCILCRVDGMSLNAVAQEQAAGRVDMFELLDPHEQPVALRRPEPPPPERSHRRPRPSCLPL